MNALIDPLSSPMSQPGLRWQRGLQIVLLAIAWFACAKLSLLIQHVPPGTAALWPSSGVALVALLLYGPGLWPGVALGAILLGYTEHLAWSLALSSVLGQVLEAVLGCALLRRSGFDALRLASLRDVLALGAYAVVIAALAGSLVSSLGQAPLGSLTLTVRLSIWFGWWVGDATGILVVAPLLLVWRGWQEFRPKAAELGMLTVVTLALGLAAWIDRTLASGMQGALANPVLLYLSIPLAIWASVRLAMFGATFISFLATLILLLHGTVDHAYERLLDIGFIAVTSFTALCVGAIFAERARTEKDLHVSRERYRTLVDTMNEGLVSQDHRGLITYVNDRFCSMLGYAREELLGRPFLDFLTDSSRRRLGADAPGEGPSELELKRKDGESAYLLVSPQVIRSAAGQVEGNFAICADIGQRKRMEVSLRVSEQQYRLLADNVTDMISVLSAEGLYEYVSPSCQSLLGYTPEELTGTSIFDLLHPDDAPGARRIHRLALHSATPLSNEYRIRRADGSYIWFDTTSRTLGADDTGQPVRVITSSRDVSKRMEAEQTQVEIRERLRKQNAILGQLARDKEMSSGDLEAFARLLTRTAAHILNVERVSIWLFDEEQTCLRCVCMYHLSDNTHTQPPTEFVRVQYPRYFEMLSRGRSLAADDAFSHPATTEFAKVHLMPLGITSILEAPVWLGGRIAGVVRHGHVGPPRKWAIEEQDFAGSVADFVSLALESSERRRAEEQVKQHQAELAHVSRLSTMGEMASGLAHELNQPLCAIATYCDASLRMLKSGECTAEKLSPALEQASFQARRAGEIIRRLRDFVFKGKLDKVEVDVNELVRETARFSAAADSREFRVTLDLEMDGDLPKAHVVRIQIEQVLLNLIRNATEAMRDAGTEDPRIRIRTSCDEHGKIHVVVKDNGPGLDVDGLKHVFDAFYTTKASGMGMGLAISRSIIEAHAGRLWVESEKGAGAAFHFTFARSA